MTDIRCDRGQLQGRMTRTDEGYLRGDAVVTRTGVFIYKNADGSIRRELRHPDDVFAADSIESMKMIPVTDNHPGELVNSDNAQELSIGHVGENIRIDGSKVLAPLSINQKRGTGSVDMGKRELSLGYSLELLKEDGEYQGQPYTHRQTNIRYNHLAVVDRARAGGEARLNLDGAAVQEPDDGQTPTKPETRSDSNMEKVNLDGISYDAAPEVAKAYTKAQERIDALESDLKEAKTAKETADARYDEAKAELDKVKETHNDEAIRNAAKARVELERNAARVVNDDLSNLSDREVMEKVIASRHDGIDLSQKEPAYVQARFDAIIDTLPDEKAINRQREKVNADGAPNEQRTDSASKREDSLKSVRDQWKPAANA